jgi:trimethyllysine dioxygenase
VTYEEAMSEDDAGLYKWLNNVVRVLFRLFRLRTVYESWPVGTLQARFGFSFVTGVPVSTEATERLVERISFIRETQCKFFDSQTCAQP